MQANYHVLLIVFLQVFLIYLGTSSSIGFILRANAGVHTKKKKSQNVNNVLKRKQENVIITINVHGVICQVILGMK